ncbi:ATP-binding cassette domain-containing protein [Acidiferrimicrobium sp. IK]|uniref:ABC transporter ATP-binding protein n=1 Tax=Acidiferrimicrobium sp. IK TaxID=2871700 RepID=UPI0021CAED83|nr:ATP-binding cassette domain-containing protein [Acidiferrimicrobium sp. IK]MCU4183837.1 ATP-binding cassette domain-containing protein [Acidiferrimicrobium sp. IK]
MTDIAIDMAAANAVTITDISMQFQGLVVLDGVSATVERGQAVAVIGPNGSGKTTLLNVISGIYRPVSGTVHVGRELVTGFRPHRVAQLRVGRTFQHLELPKDLTLLRVALLGRHTVIKRGVFSYALGIPHFNSTEKVNRQAAMDALRSVGLDHLAQHQVQDLSYGQAKRADLARALAADPTVLLLDEPAAGLNDQEREELLALLQRIQKERQVALVVIEHDMSFVTGLCSKLVVLSSGRKIYDGDSTHLRQDPTVMQVLLGPAAQEFGTTTI